MQDEWVIARVFQKPGEVPPARTKHHRLTSADASCFSDSTSASVAGGGGASASSAPRALQLPDASLFAAADGDGGSYLGYGHAIANNADGNGSSHTNNLVTGRELVPCFSTSAPAAMDATTLLGIGQYNPPAPLAFEPPPANFFTSLRALQQQQDTGSNIQLPFFLTSGAASSALGGGGGGAHHHWGPTGMMDLVKVEGAMGRAAPPQMAVGPGQLDGAYAWGF